MELPKADDDVLFFLRHEKDAQYTGNLVYIVENYLFVNFGSFSFFFLILRIICKIYTVIIGNAISEKCEQSLQMDRGFPDEME